MNANAPMDKRWLGWLREQMDLACDMSVAVGTLRKLGYSDAAIVAGMDAVRPRGNALELGVQQPPLLRRNPPTLHKIDTQKFDAYTLDDFLSPKECARIIALTVHHLQPSMLSYASPDAAFRTSKTSHLCHLKSPVALNIDAKICKTLGIRAEYSEGIQAQRYDVGEQFKPHWDYFEPGTESFRRLAGVRGNRTWTFMVYLNDGMEGGATRFTVIDHAVKPKIGMALFWYNLNADGSPNTATMHCGEPVVSGHKNIITKWFRVHGDGPLFHE
jgi:prolyl 4-hydroxylase